MKIGFVFGTRPEIIKLSPVIRECRKRKIKFFTIHTGQHYSKSMSDFFIDELNLPHPDYKLKIRSRAAYRQGDHTGRMMVKIEDIFLKEMPDIVVVHGDTNTTLAGALTASKISTTKSFTGFQMKVAHIEAGLRSYDRGMPEETNRVIADHLSDFLFVPTKNSKNIVIGEGIKSSKVHVTGNTIVDAVYHVLSKNGTESKILKDLKMEKNKYILLTLHRQENVDDKKRVKVLLKAINEIHKKNKLPILFPIHPRTIKMFESFGIKLSEGIKCIDPCGFSDFIKLESNAALILTDSGGVQEEACVLGVPCVTLRTSTERPETVSVGANIIAGINPKKIVSETNKMLKTNRKWKNPLGNGNAAKKIIDILMSS